MMKMLVIVFTSILFCFLFVPGYSQASYINASYSDIENLDENGKTYKENLAIFYNIKKAKEQQALKDSGYSLTLLKIAKYELYLNNNYNLALSYTTKAIDYNKKICSKSLSFYANYNLALCYDNQFAYTQALNFCDSTIIYCKSYHFSNAYEVNAHWIKANIYLDIGDYQKTIDESNSGLAITSSKNDTLGFIYFLNKKATALFYVNDINQSFKNARLAIAYNKTSDFFELNMSYKTMAKIYEGKKLFDSALFFYTKATNSCLASNNNSLIADNYIDLGNFYQDATHDYINANKYYYKAIEYANKITDGKTASSTKSSVFTNLCETSLRQHNLKDAEQFMQQAFLNVSIKNENILNDVTGNQLNAINNKDLVTYLLFNKTNLLLHKFKETRQNIYLQACLKTALLADFVITTIRHEQISEKSKLYWRNKTRDLYPNAIEACYLANNNSLAFYFIEKSRAVLLNDKLNELGAIKNLSAEDAGKQEDFQIKIVELEQKLSALNESTQQYQTIQLQLLDVKNNFEQFIKSLEQKYPAYYQYKYADDVSSLAQLQLYLKQNSQSFVYYFFGDTATYILAIMPNSTKFLRLSSTDFDKQQLSKFLQFCADKEMLMSFYNVFAALSNSIYKTIFQPLGLPGGRVIICSDNIVIPFDALCTDKTGKDFLLKKYSFSYVYSARSLKQAFHNNTKATGNFIGFAPVSFATNLNVQDLKNAADALQASSSYYNTNKIFTYQNATRNNFFKLTCNYSIVNIFSHAHADTTGEEPVLYMHDSLIHLSELQLLNNPATRLVLLSACQTNVGKNATGEGIYSLARGFATAGIPAVAATLWKADEQTIYAVSEKFNQYLSEGMNKDEALQKAKLYFINNNAGNEKLLPYYWANMILIGNAEPVKFIQNSSNINWRIIAFCIVIIFAAYFIYTKAKIRKLRKYNRV